MHDFDVFNECVTNRLTDRPPDTAYYRDARTHLKTNHCEPDIEPNIKPDRADLGIRFYDILIQDVAITKTPWTGEYRNIHPCI